MGLSTSGGGRASLEILVNHKNTQYYSQFPIWFKFPTATILSISLPPTLRTSNGQTCMVRYISINVKKLDFIHVNIRATSQSYNLTNLNSTVWIHEAYKHNPNSSYQ